MCQNFKFVMLNCKSRLTCLGIKGGGGSGAVHDTNDNDNGNNGMAYLSHLRGGCGLNNSGSKLSFSDM